MAKKKKSYEDDIIDVLRAAYTKINSDGSAGYLTQSTTTVRDWVSTGDFMLDVVLSNRVGGGIPVGRLTEISGGEGAGKSLLGAYILADTQRKGGIGVLFDTEFAASLDVLAAAGVDIDKLIISHPGSMEETFHGMEKLINKLAADNEQRLVTVVWDSVAATPTKAEVEGNYGDQTIAMGARIISAGLRKIIPVISKHNICMVFINQLRTNIGQSFGDNKITPGGKAIPYHASVRLRLNHFKQIKNSNGDLVGRIVKCEVKKNKVAPPMRTMYYTIRWGDKLGAWIESGETMWDSAIRSGLLEKVTAQKYKAKLASGEIEFTRRAFNKLLEEDENFTKEFKDALATTYVIKPVAIDEKVTIEDATDAEGLE